MGEVTALGYVVVSAADLQAWRVFAEDCLGLATAPSPDAATDRPTLFLRSDQRSWRLAVEEGADGGVVALGFEVSSREGFERLVSKLQAAGLSVKEAPEVATQRRVAALVQVSDPSGVPLEFFYGAAIDKGNFVSPRGAHFVTGAQGFGHAVITVSDSEEAYNFYVGLLGFRLSDIITIGTVAELQFTSPNPRHHSLAFASITGAPGGALQHIMLEVDDLDTVGRALDYCMDNGVRIHSGLGKHTNDHMVSFYCLAPSGLTIEYGTGGREISESIHQVATYDAPSFWGHRPPGGADREAEVRAVGEQIKGAK